MAYGRIANIGEGTTSFTMTNKTVVQSLDNILMFTGTMSGVTAAADAAIFKLPTGMEPGYVIRFPMICSNSGTFITGHFFIRTNGYIYTSQALNNAVVYFNGVCININNKFYSSAIGNNNTSNMTYPIGRQ